MLEYVIELWNISRPHHYSFSHPILPGSISHFCQAYYKNVVVTKSNKCIDISWIINHIICTKITPRHFSVKSNCREGTDQPMLLSCSSRCWAVNSLNTSIFEVHHGCCCKKSRGFLSQQVALTSSRHSNLC